jgi:hypothetical protein
VQQVGCGAGELDADDFGNTSEALLSAATINRTVSGTFKNVHETSVAFQQGCNSGKGGWVVGFNNNSASATTFAGSSRFDATAGLWTATSISSGLAWGNPGPSPFNGSAFAGWRSDPSLAAVTNPSLNPTLTNSRMLYSMLATNGNDAIVAYSDNCFSSGKGTSYLNTNASGGSVDNPVIGSDPVAPYKTFAIWTAATAPLGRRAYLNEFAYSTAGVFSKGTEVLVPALPGKFASHPTLSVGHYNACDGKSHEAVYVAYSTSNAGRCAFDGKPNIKSDQSWYTALYDADTSTWVGGPWLVASDAQWPACVGNEFLIANDGRPRLATSNKGEGFWVVVPQSSPLGTRIHTYSASIVCSGGAVKPPTFTDSPTCDPDGKSGGCFSPGGGSGGSGGNTGKVSDEWGPAVAFSDSLSGPSLVVTFMGTRNELTNRYAGVYMTYSQNFLALTNPVVISRQTAPLSTAVLFDHTVSGWEWSDYNGLGTDGKGTFLTTWGGDSRNFSTLGYSSIGSTFIQ